MKNKKLSLLCSIVLLYTMVLLFAPMNVKAASNISLNKKAVTIYVGNSRQLKLKNASAGAVKWSSTNRQVVSVDKNGKITGNKKGKAKVKAQYRNKNYSCSVTVKSAKISEKSLTLFYGSGYQLNVVKSHAKPKWTSSDKSIVKVNDNGYIQARKNGTATITAKIKNESYICKVKVVSALNNKDFNYDSPNDKGYTNFIDFYLDGHKGYYRVYIRYADTKANRGIEVGDTYKDVIAKFGYTESYDVTDCYIPNGYKEYFSNAARPRTVVIYSYTYKSGYTMYKQFFFDANGTLVAVFWDDVKMH